MYSNPYCFNYLKYFLICCTDVWIDLIDNVVCKDHFAQKKIFNFFILILFFKSFMAPIFSIAFHICLYTEQRQNKSGADMQTENEAEFKVG